MKDLKRVRAAKRGWCTRRGFHRWPKVLTPKTRDNVTIHVATCRACGDSWCSEGIAVLMEYTMAGEPGRALKQRMRDAITANHPLLEMLKRKGA